jgi:hypothetical protein
MISVIVAALLPLTVLKNNFTLLPNYQLPNYPITNYPITQSPNYPITQLPNYPITQLPNYPITPHSAPAAPSPAQSAVMPATIGVSAV